MSKRRRTFGGIGLALIAGAIAAGGAEATSVSVPNPVPYAEDAEIAGKIKSECRIDAQLAEFIRAYAEARGDEVEFHGADAPRTGRVLEIEIRDAVSGGNAFIGHRKSTSIRGKLVADGEVIGTFRGRRDSMGGAFAGYKGSCSVLGRTVKALGKDVADWLAAPAMDSDLGDLK